ncbi:DUF2955 domain-containing protein [Kaistia dalseonensis]|uniref:DUF2955 domain-containing protein n=1 Tax=Kaistia dalseonensis TaxID=410840 RepID=A0ABU0H797_9HYPH|nr:DUF2955 domain-containing protein [Kaistia dalseonensis]MCX5495576.1 DUF2955 domain-containing protein [Kaistia dalseonensis]MDQ0438168.1 hypothetical protein [Kaistia dalseonensis]
MQPDATLPDPRARTQLIRARHLGLRLAFVVSVGFTVSVLLGSPLAFLAPMLALQFITASPKPPTLAATITMAGIVVFLGETLTIAMALLGDRPAVLLVMIGLLYFLCFMTQALGKALPIVGLVLTISTVTLVLGMANIDLGESIVLTLAKSILMGVVLVWFAHAFFPEPDGANAKPAQPVHVLTAPGLRALANTAILLGAVLICFVGRNFSTAIVVPLTVISLIGQADIVTNQRAFTGLLVVNMIGGIVASIAFTILSMRPELVFLFPILLIVSLFFGGRAADPKSGRIFAGALGIFLILFGLGVSPIPTTATESFVTRIGLVLFAILYTITGIGLLWRAEPLAKPEAPAMTG